MTVTNTETLQHQAEQFAQHLIDLYGEDEVKRVVGPASTLTLQSSYRNNPVKFGQDILGDSYTSGIAEVMKSVHDYPVTLARSANSVGKTHGAARIALWFFKMWDDAQVYTTAAPPLENLQRLLWGEIGSVVRDNPNLISGFTRRTLHIERSPLSFLTGVAIPSSGTAEQREAKFSGKHAPHLLFIVDEGDAVPPEVYQGIESCMSGGHARLLVLLNPRMQSGPTWQLERDKRANVVELSAFNHPNVTSGTDIIKGAVTRQTTVRRINEWTRPLAEGENPDSECFQVPDFLVGSTARSLDGKREYPPLPAGWRKIENSAFYYMVLGIYPAAGESQLISRAWVDNARTRWDVYVAQNGEKGPSGVLPVMGQDVAEFGRDANAACFRYGGWVARFITWDGMDTDLVGTKAKALYDERGCTHAFVDGTGVGSSVAPKMMRAGAQATSVKVASKPTYATEMGEFGLMRDQLWWSVREWLRNDPGAMIPPDEMLVEELLAPTYAVKNGFIKVMKKDTMREILKRSPDRADALCLTFAPSGYGVGFAAISTQSEQTTIEEAQDKFREEWLRGD